MSAPAKSSGSPPAVVASLDGKRVQIGGYVVPLDFDATRVKEFLLVPFVGACIHVPPPPPNQIVYVKAEGGVDVKGTFDPVWVTGTLTVTAGVYWSRRGGLQPGRRKGGTEAGRRTDPAADRPPCAGRFAELLKDSIAFRQGCSLIAAEPR